MQQTLKNRSDHHITPFISSVSIYALAENNNEVTFIYEKLQTANDNYAKDNCLTSEKLACDFDIAYDGKVIGRMTQKSLTINGHPLLLFTNF